MTSLPAFLKRSCAIRLTVPPVPSVCLSSPAPVAVRFWRPRWEEFDLSRGVWTKPSHHTKQQRTEHSPLSSGATAILAQMRAADPQGTHLFPGNSPGRPLQDIRRFWKRILGEAGIPHARLHDLRHTYASHLVSSGLGLPIVGRLLGHTQVATTQRYAPSGRRSPEGGYGTICQKNRRAAETRHRRHVANRSKIAE